jgi:hypothetical protein
LGWYYYDSEKNKVRKKKVWQCFLSFNTCWKAGIFVLNKF